MKQYDNISILGVGIDHQLYTREHLHSPWVNIPNSGSVLALSLMPDGRILAVGTDHHLWIKEDIQASWQQVANSCCVIDVAVLTDGRILGVGLDHYLYVKDTLSDNWSQIPNSGMVLGVTVCDDHSIIGIGMGHTLWQRKTLTSPWQHINNSGAVIGICAVPGNGILGIGMDHALYTRNTLTSAWQSIANSGSVVGVALMPTVNTIEISEIAYLHSEWGDKQSPGTVQAILVSKSGHQQVGLSQLSYKGDTQYIQADEYIQITNNSQKKIDLSHWSIASLGTKLNGDTQLYVFPNGTTLDKQQSLRVYTHQTVEPWGGHSFNSQIDIWRHEGDCATLFDHQNKIIDQLSYGDSHQ